MQITRLLLILLASMMLSKTTNVDEQVQLKQEYNEKGCGTVLEIMIQTPQKEDTTGTFLSNSCIFHNLNGNAINTNTNYLN